MSNKMTIKDFNTKYDLKNINLNLFDKAKMDVEVKSSEIAGKPTKTWQDVVKRFFRNKWNIIFVLIFLTIILITIIAPIASKYSSSESINSSSPKVIGLAQPSWIKGFGTEWRYLSGYDMGVISSQGRVLSVPEYIPDGGNWKVLVSQPGLENQFLPFGTDEVGRDVWTKLWVGTAWSLKLAFLVAFVETIIGVSIGIYLGMNVGKTPDTLIMRIVEIFSAVPVLIWMIFFSLIIGTGFWSIALVLIIVGWVAPLFQARMFTIKVKDAEFINAAKVSGTSNIGIIYKHILPNIIGRLVVGFVQRIPAVIFFEASLVFLGFQVGGDNGITLGNIINTSRSHILEQPWDVISASAVILSLTISLQIIANGLRDAFDAKVSA